MKMSAFLAAAALASLTVLVPAESAQALQGSMTHGSGTHGSIRNDSLHAMGMTAMQSLQSLTGEIAGMTALLRSDYKTKPSIAQMNRMKSDMKGIMSMKPGGDRMFLLMLLPHHQGAIDMSRLALTNSSSPRIKRLAGRIIRDQSAEIGDFRKSLTQSTGSGTAHRH